MEELYTAWRDGVASSVVVLRAWKASRGKPIVSSSGIHGAGGPPFSLAQYQGREGSDGEDDDEENEERKIAKVGLVEWRHYDLRLRKFEGKLVNCRTRGG